MSVALATIPLWLAWNLEPLPLLAIAALATAYAYGMGPWRRRLDPTPQLDRGKIAFFVTGLAFWVVAICSPLATLGMHYLLTAHMVQHVLLSVVVPPLLLLGTPAWLLEPLFQHERVRKVGRFLTQPVVAFGLYNLNMWVWHIPALLDATPPNVVVELNQLLDTGIIIGVFMVIALVVAPRILQRGKQEQEPGASGRPVSTFVTLGVVLIGVIGLGALNFFDLGAVLPSSEAHNPIHVLMDATFLGTAILYWCPILSPVPQLPRISPVFGMLYMFISTQPMMALGALLVFAGGPLYHLYDGAPALWGLSRLGDQQLAGLIMWLIMDIPLLLTITILFFRWLNEQERQQRASEALAYEEEDLIWQQNSTAASHS